MAHPTSEGKHETGGGQTGTGSPSPWERVERVAKDIENEFRDSRSALRLVADQWVARLRRAVEDAQKQPVDPWAWLPQDPWGRTDEEVKDAIRAAYEFVSNPSWLHVHTDPSTGEDHSTVEGGMCPGWQKRARRCWFLHDWTKWEVEERKAIWVPLAGSRPARDTVTRRQVHTCLRCGLREERGL